MTFIFVSACNGAEDFTYQIHVIMIKNVCMSKWKKQGYTVCATFWFINQSLIFLSMLWKRFQKSFDSNVVRQMVMHILCLYLSRCSRSHVSVLCICSNELRDLSRLFFFFCMQPSCKSLVVWGLCFYCVIHITLEPYLGYGCWFFTTSQVLINERSWAH